MSLKFKQNKDGSWVGYSEGQKRKTSAPNASDSRANTRNKKDQKTEETPET